MLPTVEMLYNGANHYSAPKVGILDDEYSILLTWLFSEYGPFMGGQKVTPQDAIDQVDRSKACGLPWRTFVGPTKGDFLSRFVSAEETLDFCVQCVETQICVFSSTIKDELRPVGKNGRFFTPAPVELVVVGNWLFSHQLRNMIRNVGNQPCCIGLQMPGKPLVNVYESLLQFSNKFVSFDASKWDASCPLWAFQLCRDLRKMLMPDDCELIDRYYDQVYAGLVSVNGDLYQLAGQKSGQTLTSFDNSLALSAIFMLHAVRKGWSYTDFKANVKYYVYGDDLIYSSKDDYFVADLVYATFLSCGVYLESPYHGFCDVLESTFLGTRPVFRECFGGTYLIPMFRKDKLISSLSWKRKGLGDIDFFAKLVAILVLCYADKDLYERMRRDILDWYGDRPELATPAVAGLLAYVVDPAHVFRLCTGLE